MALRKTITLPNGLTGDYWKVTEINITNLGNGTASIKAVLTLWKDKARSNTADPLPVSISIDGLDNLPLHITHYSDLNFAANANPTVWVILQKAVYLQIRVLAAQVEQPDSVKFFSDAIDD